MRRDDDQTIERLLAGDGDEDALAAALAELRARGHVPIAGLEAERHITAAARAARAASADLGMVLTIPPSGRRSRARRLVAVAAALFVSVSGLSAAGALPGAVRSGLASLVRPLGILLPDPDRSDRERRSDVPDATSVATSDPLTPLPRVPAPLEGSPGPPGSGPPVSTTAGLPVSTTAGPPVSTTAGPPWQTPKGPPPGIPTVPPEAPRPPG